MSDEIVTPEASAELSILDQVTDGVRNLIGLQRSAAQQALVDETRALQPALKQLASRAKAYETFETTHRKTLSGLRDVCDTAANEPVLAQIVAPLEAALDGFSRELRAVPTSYAKLAADVANASTLDELDGPLLPSATRQSLSVNSLPSRDCRRALTY